MDTRDMIRELRSISAKYANDRVFTGQLYIAQMCEDVADRLEEQEYLIDNMCSAEMMHLCSIPTLSSWTRTLNRSTFNTSEGAYWINYNNPIERHDQAGTLFFVSFNDGTTQKIAEGIVCDLIMKAYNNAISRYKNKLLVRFHEEKNS